MNYPLDIPTCRVLILSCSSLTIALAGTTGHVVQAAPRLTHASHHFGPRLVGSNSMSHDIVLSYAYTYESICDEEEAARTCLFLSSHVS